MKKYLLLIVCLCVMFVPGFSRHKPRAQQRCYTLVNGTQHTVHINFKHHIQIDKPVLSIDLDPGGRYTTCFNPGASSSASLDPQDSEEPRRFMWEGKKPCHLSNRLDMGFSIQAGHTPPGTYVIKNQPDCSKPRWLDPGPGNRPCEAVDGTWELYYPYPSYDTHFTDGPRLKIRSLEKLIRQSDGRPSCRWDVVIDGGPSPIRYHFIYTNDGRKTEVERSVNGCTTVMKGDFDFSSYGTEARVTFFPLESECGVASNTGETWYFHRHNSAPSAIRTLAQVGGQVGEYTKQRLIARERSPSTSSATGSPAGSQAPARGSILRTPFGRMVYWVPGLLGLAPVEKPPNTWENRSRYGITLRRVRYIDSTEEVVQISVSRYIGNNTSVACVLAENTADRPFECSDIPSPSVARAETLFVFHRTSAETSPERGYIRTPGGKWITFTPFTNTYGDNPRVTLVDDMVKAYNFEIWVYSQRFFEGPPR